MLRIDYNGRFIQSDNDVALSYLFQNDGHRLYYFKLLIWAGMREAIAAASSFCFDVEGPPPVNFPSSLSLVVSWIRSLHFPNTFLIASNHSLPHLTGD